MANGSWLRKATLEIETAKKGDSTDVIMIASSEHNADTAARVAVDLPDGLSLVYQRGTTSVWTQADGWKTVADVGDTSPLLSQGLHLNDIGGCSDDIPEDWAYARFIVE